MENKINSKEQAQTFANFFSNKVNTSVDSSEIKANLYNYKKLLDCVLIQFMTMNNVLVCLKYIKIKNSKGYDRIPQRVLNEGAKITDQFQTFVWLQKSLKN